MPGHVSEHIWCLDVVCLVAVTRRHEDAMKVLKDAQGIVSVINHTGTLKMVVKYSPRGTYIHIVRIVVLCVCVRVK